MRLILFILVYLFANPAAAIFDVVPSDQSMKYLAQLFGGQIGNVSLGAGSAPALNAMFEKFNLIVSTVGVIVLGYISVLSTINTAQEGTAMGKKWSAVWTPFRSVLGMILLVPSPASGYSMIQSFVMWVILQGIGAANSVWSIVLEQYRLGNSAVAVNRLTLGSGDNSIENLFESATTVGESVKNLFPASNYQPSANPGDTSNPTETQTLWLALSCMHAANAMANGTMLFQETDPEYPIEGEAVQVRTPQEIVDRIYRYGGQVQPHLTLSSKSVSSDGPSASGVIHFGVPTASSSSTAFSVCGRLNISVNLKSSELAEGSLPSGTYKNDQLKARAQQLLAVKFAAIKNAISAAQPIFGGIINGTLGPRNMGSSSYNATYFPLGQLSNSTPETTGYVHAARLAYLSSLVSSTRETIEEAASPTLLEMLGSFFGIETAQQAQQRANSLIELGKSVGWSTAGQFYFLLSSVSGQAKALSGLVNIGTDPVTSINLDYLFGGKSSYGSAYSARYMLEQFAKQVLYYVKNDSYSFDNNNSFGSQTGASKLGPATAGVSGLAGTMTKAWASLITGSGDPLVGIAKFGQELLLAAEITWIVVAIGTIALSIGLAVCACSNPGFGALISMLAGIMMPILSVMVLLWGIGATLGVWVPMVPYIMWSTALLGWFILVIEAIVSAPILALGLISPAQDELGPAKSGLMILAGLFLRPTLMIFGFILGGRLFNVFVGYINYGLSDVMEGIWQVTQPLIASLLLPLFVYMGIILAALNKCFALIHILPDKVLRWIGGPSEQTDMSMAENAKGTFEKGKGEVQKGMAKGSEKMIDSMKGGAEEISKRAAASEGEGGGGGDAATSGSESGGQPSGQPGGQPSGTGAKGAGKIKEGQADGDDAEDDSGQQSTTGGQTSSYSAPQSAGSTKGGSSTSTQPPRSTGKKGQPPATTTHDDDDDDDAQQH